MPAPASGGSQGALGRGQDVPSFHVRSKPLWPSSFPAGHQALAGGLAPPASVLKTLWNSAQADLGFLRLEIEMGGHGSKTLRKASPCLAWATAQAALQTHLSLSRLPAGVLPLLYLSPLLPAGNVGCSFTPVPRLWVRSQAFGSPDVPRVSFPRLGPCPVPVLCRCLSTRLPLVLWSTAWSQYCRDNKKHKALAHTHTSC